MERKNSISQKERSLIKQIGSFKKGLWISKILEIVCVLAIIILYILFLTLNSSLWLPAIVIVAFFFFYKIINYFAIHYKFKRIKEENFKLLEQNIYFPLMVRKTKRYAFISRQNWNYFLTSLNNKSLWKQ